MVTPKIFYIMSIKFKWRKEFLWNIYHKNIENFVDKIITRKATKSVYKSFNTRIEWYHNHTHNIFFLFQIKERSQRKKSYVVSW